MLTASFVLSFGSKPDDTFAVRLRGLNQFGQLVPVSNKMLRRWQGSCSGCVPLMPVMQGCPTGSRRPCRTGDQTDLAAVVVVVVVVVVVSYTDPHPYGRMRNLTMTLLFKHRAIYKLNTKNVAFSYVHL